MSSPLVYIDESRVADLLTWPLVIQAVDQALQSVVVLDSPAATPNDDEPSSAIIQSDDLPTCVQKARTATIVPDGSGLLFTMPGFIGNYTPSTTTPSASPTPPVRTQTLGCKLVTSFQANTRRDPPLPAIAATIVLFDPSTGTLAAVLHGTQITTWRTVAASLVATRELWFRRHNVPTTMTTATDAYRLPTLAIVGCGVEGRAHVIGMASTFPLGAIQLWNRTASRAHALHTDLLQMRPELRNGAHLRVRTADSVGDCVRDADIIVVATYSSDALVFGEQLTRRGVHINAVGAGPGNHHAELADSVYARSEIYVDTLVTASVELATLQHPIRGQVGDVIVGRRPMPAPDAMTVFQSMGMAVEDCAVAQAIFDKYRQQQEVCETEK